MSLPLIALAIAAFAIGTTEFLITGLLPVIAADLRVSIPTTGLLVTGYALGVVIGGPILTILANRLSRKLTLMLLMGLFVLGNLLCALAPSYWLLMGARVITAFCHAAFFGIAVVAAADLVPPNRRASAMSLVLAGVTVANIFGVPAGTALGQAMGWRSAFWAVTAIGAIAAAAIAVWLPSDVHGDERPSVAREFKVLGKSQVLLALALSFLLTAATVSVYAFIAPLLEEVTGILPETLPWYLLIFGVGGTVGILAGGRLADWKPTPSIIGIYSALVLLYLVLLVASHSPPFMALTLFFWSCIGFAAITPLQVKVVDAAERAPNLASALNQSALNLGIAVGPAIGGAALMRGVGYGSLPWIGAFVALAGLFLAAFSLALERGPSSGR